MYNQTATYWPRGSPDGYGGWVYAAPQLLNVRWEDKVEQIVSPTGEVVTSSAKVWVTSQLELGGYLFYGQSVAVDPESLTSPPAYKIIKVVSIPSVMGDKFEYRVFL